MARNRRFVFLDFKISLYHTNAVVNFKRSTYSGKLRSTSRLIDDSRCESPIVLIAGRWKLISMPFSHKPGLNNNPLQHMKNIHLNVTSESGINITICTLNE